MWAKLWIFLHYKFSPRLINVRCVYKDSALLLRLTMWAILGWFFFYLRHHLDLFHVLVSNRLARSIHRRRIESEINSEKKILIRKCLHRVVQKQSLRFNFVHACALENLSRSDITSHLSRVLPSKTSIIWGKFKFSITDFPRTTMSSSPAGKIFPGKGLRTCGKVCQRFSNCLAVCSLKKKTLNFHRKIA